MLIIGITCQSFSKPQHWHHGIVPGMSIIASMRCYCQCCLKQTWLKINNHFSDFHVIMADDQYSDPLVDSTMALAAQPHCMSYFQWHGITASGIIFLLASWHLCWCQHHCHHWGQGIITGIAANIIWKVAINCQPLILCWYVTMQTMTRTSLSLPAWLLALWHWHLLKQNGQYGIKHVSNFDMWSM